MRANCMLLIMLGWGGGGGGARLHRACSHTGKITTIDSHDLGVFLIIKKLKFRISLPMHGLGSSLSSLYVGAV